MVKRPGRERGRSRSRRSPRRALLQRPQGPSSPHERGSTVRDRPAGLAHRGLPALREVFFAARHQRCWVHKARNVTNALPKSAQPGVTKAMQEIYNAEDRAHAEKAIEAFAKTYGAKWPKAVAKIADDRDELLAFYDFPAEPWIHLRTTNPIESTFSTVKLRTKVTRGAGSPASALAMVFKLVESAQVRWRAITGAHLVALVRSGARFENGVMVEREETAAA
ncbi:transposase [Kitasatospora sp. NPDC101447]|uniref:transposase n=1 Tax=Kitasatospora sp. NPDC101447 TaxID=3364102 RepID=UPI003825806B